MAKKEDVKKALLVEQRVYNDSPQVTVTYKDLARLIDHILDLQNEDIIKGFNNKEKRIG